MPTNIELFSVIIKLFGKYNSYNLLLQYQKERNKKN